MSIRSKAGIATRDVEVMVTLNVLRTYSIQFYVATEAFFVVVEGYRHFCWVCGVAGHLAKTCPTKKPVLLMKQALVPTSELPREEVTKKASGSEWTEVLKRRAKVATSSPQHVATKQQQELPEKAAVNQQQNADTKKQQEQAATNQQQDVPDKKVDKQWQELVATKQQQKSDVPSKGAAKQKQLKQQQSDQ